MASLEDKIGVISKNYNPENNQVYSVDQILNSYWDNKIRARNIKINSRYVDKISYEHDYNLKRLPKIIEFFLKKENLPYSKDIYNKLLEQFIIQILCGNIDLRSENIELIISKKPKISPIYDFGCFGEINLLAKKSFSYQFQYQQIPKDVLMLPKETLKTFLNAATKKELETFKYYFEQIKEIKKENVLEEMKEQTENDIPIEIKTLLLEKLKTNLNNIDSIVKRNFR